MFDITDIETEIDELATTARELFEDVTSGGFPTKHDVAFLRGMVESIDKLRIEGESFGY